MSRVVLLLAVLLASVGGAAERTSLWLDASFIDPQQSEVIIAAFERMAGGTERLEIALRREQADVLVRLRLGSRRTDVDTGAGAARSSFGADPTEDLTAAASPSSTIELDFHVVDVGSGETVFDQRLRCSMPLTTGRRIADPAFRARLSHVIDVIDDWAEARPRDASDPSEFGPLLDGLDAVGKARALYREAVGASRAGYQEAALGMFAEAQPVFKQMGLRQEEGLAWEWLAALMATTGRPLERSIAYAKQSVKIAREVSDESAEARALTLLGALEARARNYPRALELLQAARRQAHESGAPLVEAMAIADLAGLTAMRGQFESALELQERALQLTRQAGNPRAEGRVRLAMAVVSAHTDDRDRAETLAALAEVVRLARVADDRSLEESAAFVQANVRLGTTDFRQLLAGEVDAIRAYKLARRLDDRRGETAALALLGAFAHRLVRPEHAAEYLALAHEKASEAGYVEIVADSIELLGEMAPSYERGLSLLDGVVGLRRQTQDTRKEIKTLSDMSRLHSGLNQHDAAWERYQEAAAALERYVGERTADPYAEDLRASFITVIKSLAATRTALPFLESFLELQFLLAIPNPSWVEGG